MLVRYLLRLCLDTNNEIAQEAGEALLGPTLRQGLAFLVFHADVAEAEFSELLNDILALAAMLLACLRRVEILEPFKGYLLQVVKLGDARGHEAQRIPQEKQRLQ